jgi:hypothetical protein
VAKAEDTIQATHVHVRAAPVPTSLHSEDVVRLSHRVQRCEAALKESVSSQTTRDFDVLERARSEMDAAVRGCAVRVNAQLAERLAVIDERLRHTAQYRASQLSLEGRIASVETQVRRDAGFKVESSCCCTEYHFNGRG